MTPRGNITEFDSSAMASGFPIVAIGASAGGLDAFERLLATLPSDSGMAYILVQHLDPDHESMLVTLLARNTKMEVCEAADGMAILPDRVHVIPPGFNLSVTGNTLRLSTPDNVVGPRLPFDFLLNSLAAEHADRAICVVLSGTGTDGSLGSRAILGSGGLVVVQDPFEAAFDGMPRSAIATGPADLVLPIEEMAKALANYGCRISRNAESTDVKRDVADDAWLDDVIEVIRERSGHDFRSYKKGTLLRRIERRMNLAEIDTHDSEGYLDLLRSDSMEIGLLVKDLYIQVTSFFRDPQVFDHIAHVIAPALVRNRKARQPLRMWVAGCSTGEEAYSLGIVFLEAIEKSGTHIELKIFASDVESDAIATAREGFYPESIEPDVGPERLERYFVREDMGYRVRQELRDTLVFTVQNVLVDPPFARLDLVSCRNMLIYLQPEAQARVLAQFHFSLVPNGTLLLGSAETVGNATDSFEVVSKPLRVYRKVGASSRVGLNLDSQRGQEVAGVTALPRTPALPRHGGLAELCRKLVIEAFAPAAVLVNREEECLFTLGPIDRFLRVTPGFPNHALMAMARAELRSPLRSAIRRARTDAGRVIVDCGRTQRDGKALALSLDVRAVVHDDNDYVLVCFVESPERGEGTIAPGETSRVEELEGQLAATQDDLRATIEELETANAEHKVSDDEHMSVNEEFQSTNEELLTSKEELQSLNEELNALNSQLQETLERQRTAANDLQNVLYSTDVATLFLDADFNIRFFTPATKALFNLLPGDIGRPLADFRLLDIDHDLLDDAKSVLTSLAPVEREIEVAEERWFVRRILPYRNEYRGVEGIVITYVDITQQRLAADALEAVRHQTDMANAAKSRFLAVASHDLRQPLQTLVLLQGLLAKAVKGTKTGDLVMRLDQALGSMSGILNTLLDINQIEAGHVRAEPVDFAIDDLLERLGDEYADHARVRDLSLRRVPCSLVVHSDPRLLEDILRNLISNALTYTQKGKILIGCRRHGDTLDVEVWDTGVGIPQNEYDAIFEEYHQLDNPARERSRGLGLGLYIVRRLTEIMGHKISLRSRPGKGSAFSLTIALAAEATAVEAREDGAGTDSGAAIDAGAATGAILVVEDAPTLRDILALALEGEGCTVVTAGDGRSALDHVAQGRIRPDLLLADYHLPGGMNGLQLADELRRTLQGRLPTIILTGDISSAANREIAAKGCQQVNKPVKLPDLMATVRQRLLDSAADSGAALESESRGRSARVFVVEDDEPVRSAIRAALEGEGWSVEAHGSAEAFLEGYRRGGRACLVFDAMLPGMGGLDLLRRLRAEGDAVPVLVITGNSDVAMAVAAMKAGASDFIEKPFDMATLDAALNLALEQHEQPSEPGREASEQLARLTPRQREVLDLVLAGQPSKVIAFDLGISQRTVENHRAAIMERTGATSLPDLARLAFAAGWKPTEHDGPQAA